MKWCFHIISCQYDWTKGFCEKKKQNRENIKSKQKYLGFPSQACHNTDIVNNMGFVENDIGFMGSSYVPHAVNKFGSVKNYR